MAVVHDDKRISPERRPIHTASIFRVLALAGIAPPRGWKAVDTSRPATNFVESFALTETVWSRVPWNPPVTRARNEARAWVWVTPQEDLDPVAPPKPTWPELTAMFRRWQLHERVERYKIANWVERYIAYSKDALIADAIAHPQAPIGIYPGAGLQHMSALVYSAHPRVVMRAPDGATVDLWTEAEQRRLLGDLAHRTNLAESARNTIHGRLQPDVTLFMDGAADEAARQDALDRVLAALQRDTLDASMRAEMVALASVDVLPADIDRAKAVLRERLEDVATGMARSILNAVSLSASCVEQEQAIRQVSARRQAGDIAIVRAATTEAAQTAYDAAVAEIEGVEVLNTPMFVSDTEELSKPTVHNVTYGTWAADGAESAFTVAELTARNPVVADSDFGDIAVTFEVDAPFDVAATHTQGSPDVTIRIFYALKGVQAPAAGEYSVRLVARNNCGPALATVTITITVAATED